MSYSFPPDAAWRALPAANWNSDAARHLLRRTGWSARPEDVDQAQRDGLEATLEKLFPPDPPQFPKPESVAKLEDATPELTRQLREATGEQKRLAQKEAFERGRAAVMDLSLNWLKYAADPSNASFAKWVLFLSDVYVISAEKVRHAGLVYQHFEIIGRNAFGPAPTLTKAISRSPAMVMYLDLNQSQRNAPNENFARELFELFVLGEGNYTEHDIKEAARAFTGYRAHPVFGEFQFLPRQHDPSHKTVFGATGPFTGDDVIDLAYRQKAAAAFLPHEMVKFYLSDAPLPIAYLDSIGADWRGAGFDLRWLAKRFFGSQLFFAPEFRGNFIKSPVQFYLGLTQDLRLDVAPLVRLSVNPLRQMGQWLFFPPNVRGWVGGRNWINAATITARRQLVEATFAPLNERNLNADEAMELATARSAGRANFVIEDAALLPLVQLSPAAAASRVAASYLPGATNPQLQSDLAEFISAGPPDQRPRRIRRAVATVMQSPEYQLC